MTWWNVLFALPSTIILVGVFALVSWIVYRRYGSADGSAASGDGMGWTYLAVSLLNAYAATEIGKHFGYPVANLGLGLSFIAIGSYLAFFGAWWVVRWKCLKQRDLEESGRAYWHDV